MKKNFIGLHVGEDTQVGSNLTKTLKKFQENKEFSSDEKYFYRPTSGRM